MLVTNKHTKLTQFPTAGQSNTHTRMFVLSLDVAFLSPVSTSVHDGIVVMSALTEYVVHH